MPLKWFNTVVALTIIWAMQISRPWFGEVRGQSPVDERPAEVDEGAFVYKASLDHDSSVPTLDQLEHISKHSVGRIASSAVKALYELANSDEHLEQRLIDIVTSQVTGQDARTTTCRYLSLRASDDTRSKLLEYVRAHPFGADNYSARHALMDLGDAQYLAFLEETCRGTSFMAYEYQTELRLMRTVRDPAQHLALIASVDSSVDRSWLVLQATRKGIPREATRDAVLTYLRLPVAATGNQDKSKLIRTSLNLGLVGDKDFDEFPSIRQLATTRTSGEESPRESERYHRTWREVHGVMHMDGAPSSSSPDGKTRGKN